jgi:dynein heavy chain 2
MAMFGGLCVRVPQVEVMKSNVQSRVAAFTQDVEKFAARWHQLKPSNDALDGDKESCMKSIQIIKDKKQEFAELLTAKEKLVYVALACIFFLCVSVRTYAVRCTYD